MEEKKKKVLVSINKRFRQDQIDFINQLHIQTGINTSKLYRDVFDVGIEATKEKMK